MNAADRKWGESESFRQTDEAWGFEGLHEHDARAKELEALEHDAHFPLPYRLWARRVRDCTPLTERGRPPQQTCKKKFCPSCACDIERRRRRSLEAAIGAMCNPALLLVSLGWCPTAELPGAVRFFRQCLHKLRRAGLRGVRVVGMIEPQILENHGHVLCNVHAHIAVDLPSGFNLTRFRTRWKELTLGKGYLDRDPNRDFRVARKDIRRLAHYMAKQASWCPRPGSLPLAALGALLQALHGQQQRIDWCRPRVARTNERRRTFFLWSEQVAMVDQALAHASGVAESADASVALELIALDYLLGEKNGDSNAIARLLPRYERVLGVKLVLVEPSGSVVYGGATLESLRGSA